ncbi:MAG TPA: MOSC domain-containing protein [Solirubrobacteraceae bacterium]|nr:MOSC domain-containing protein [Solirubrobacteraceae bacterium]
MKETRVSRAGVAPEAASFLACLATILEVAGEEVPDLSDGDPSQDWNVLAWLGSMGIGLVPVADPSGFAWPGPWIARVRTGDGRCRSVVMYGREPSGVVWDPNGVGTVQPEQIEAGFVLAAEDIALGIPEHEAPSLTGGSVEQIWVAGGVGQPGQMLDAVRVIPGVGLEGDRYTDGRGTFPSGRPGAALTLIEAEVCESFRPPLVPDEHRRNVVTRAVKLNGLVGIEFSIGAVRCRGIRLCEPCAAMQRYSERPILRPLVHRGGLRADILEAGEIRVGDPLVVAV